MPKIKSGQRPVLKPAKAMKERSKFEMDNLAYDIAELERKLAPKVVLFAREFAKGKTTIRAAAAAAGYSPRSLTQRGTQLVNHSEVIRLIDAYKRIDQLENGLPLAWKRYHLRKIVESDQAPEPAKIQALRLLAELDGDLKPGQSQGAVIHVHMDMGLNVQGQTFDHDHDAAQLEHNHSFRGGRARNVPTELLDD